MPKPVKKKKKFIEKKQATTYQLIPGYVEDEVLDNKNDIPSEPDSRCDEQQEYGIFFGGEYNYMKHLRSVDEKASLVSAESFQVEADDEVQSFASGPPLPFREFFSTDETEEEKIDPDILMALEEAPELKLDEEEIDLKRNDFLDDDFISKAGGVAPQPLRETGDGEEYCDERKFDFDGENEEDDESDDDFDESDDEFDSNPEDNLGEVEVHQGRGTKQDDIAEAQTALILRNFEEGLGFRCSVQQSDDEENMPTSEDYENLKKILINDKFSKKPMSLMEILDDKSDCPKIDTKKYLYEDVDEFEWKDAPSSKPKFDCVSILSLNSNTRNLPTDIIPPKKKVKRKEMPSVSETSEMGPPGLTLKQLDDEMRENRKADKASTFRPMDETIDEKKVRKQSIKDERKERRQEKKANKEVFAKEKDKMMRETAALSKAVKSVKFN